MLNLNLHTHEPINVLILPSTPCHKISCLGLRSTEKIKNCGSVFIRASFLPDDPLKSRHSRSAQHRHRPPGRRRHPPLSQVPATARGTGGLLERAHRCRANRALPREHSPLPRHAEFVGDWHAHGTWAKSADHALSLQTFPFDRVHAHAANRRRTVRARSYCSNVLCSSIQQSSMHGSAGKARIRSVTPATCPNGEPSGQIM
jgi:hypothetical protein